MNGPGILLEKNRQWAQQVKDEDPAFFEKLAAQQSPEYLWIGCSDSRVPANQIVGLAPGEIFVHRNVANLVLHGDLNCLAVLQYAVDLLKVKHIIVVGHYGCGGVQAAFDTSNNGMIDNWLRNINDVQHRCRGELAALEDDHARVNRLVELNVQEQVLHVAHTSIAQQAWSRGQPLAVHGWVYSLRDGLLKDLDCTVDSAAQVAEAYRVAAL